jgi:MurNAc alpha-1-phosphate uridylyltransferase
MPNSNPKPLRPTRAIVLSAGLGKRMRPLTDTIPKPMVKFLGKPLIDHALDRLAAAGITDAVVNVHYLPEVIERHVRHRKAPAITISDERGVLLDTGGGVVRALPHLGPDPFVIHNSDNTWIEGVGRNLDRLFQAWDGERMDSLLMVALGSHSIGYEGQGDFNMDPNGLLARRTESRVAPFVFTGVSLAHPRMFADAPRGAFSLNTLWDRAIATGRLYGLRLEGTWMHIGTPQALADAEKWVEDEVVR